MSFFRFCFLSFVVVTLFISGCGKDKPADPPLPPPPVADPLPTGWSKVTVTQGLVDVFFVNENIGYAAGGKNLYKSIDGGVTWTKLTIPGNYNISNIYFLDANYGWFTAYSHDNNTFGILKTTNGGGSFTKADLSGVRELADVQFLNKRLGYAATDNTLLMSVDSGNSWTTKGKFNDRPVTLFFLDSTKGWIGGSSRISFTTDGGKSFSVQQSHTNQSFPFNIQFLDGNTGWVPDSLGLYKTTNGGTTWELTPLLRQTIDVHFFNKDQGYVLQKNAILKSSDGGKTFTPVIKGSSYMFFELHFTDPKHGWVVSEDGFILRYSEP